MQPGDNTANTYLDDEEEEEDAAGNDQQLMEIDGKCDSQLWYRG